jgi:hypothetical protein
VCSSDLNQEEFMKVAKERVEKFAKENPTKGLVNKAELLYTQQTIFDDSLHNSESIKI